MNTQRNSDFGIPTFLLFAIPAAILICVLLTPLGMDNALYQSMAIDLVRFHKLPYIGSWDQNFPGIILFHAAAISLFGTRGISFRALDVLLQIGFCVIFYRLWKLWFDPKTSWFAVFIYLCFYLHRGIDLDGQRDTYGILLTLVAYYILLTHSRAESQSIVASLLAGFLIGIAVLIKPIFLGYAAIALFALPALQSNGSRIGFLVVSLVPLGLSYALYAFVPGALRQYWLSTVRFNIDLYTTFSGSTSDLLKWLFVPLYVTIPAAIGLLPIRNAHVSVNAANVPVRFKRYYAAVLAFSLVCVFIQRKYLLYHFAPWMILLTPLAAVGVQKVISLVPAKRTMQYAVILVILLAALPKIALLRSLRDPMNAREIFGRTALSIPEMMYDSVHAVDQYLDLPNNTSARIEVCSFNARLRASLARNTVGRFASLHAIGLRTDTLNPFSFTDYQKQWRAEYMDSLRLLKPKFIILARNTDCWYLHDPYTDLLHYLPGFDSLLGSTYHLDTIIGTFQVYRLNHKQNAGAGH